MQGAVRGLSVGPRPDERNPMSVDRELDGSPWHGPCRRPLDPTTLG